MCLAPTSGRTPEPHRSVGGLTAKRAAMARKPFCGTHETILKQTRDNSVANNAAARHAKGAQMNHSFHSADRSTHLKIVVLALVAGIVVAGFGISARTNSDYTQTAHVVKAGKLMTVTSSANSMVR